MKKLILSAIAVLFTTGAMAQSNDYYLPKTGISFILKFKGTLKMVMLTIVSSVLEASRTEFLTRQSTTRQ